MTTPFDACMLSHNNEPDQSISCCLRKCDQKDLPCQENCIDSFNGTIAESFGMVSLGSIEIISMLNILLILWLLKNFRILPTDETHLVLLVVMIQFVMYHIAKKTAHK